MASAEAPGLKWPIVEIDANSDFMSWDPGIPDDNLTDAELVQFTEPHHHERFHGTIVGEHDGVHFFTTGERKGINIGGYKEPLFVIGTDVEKNILYVGEGQSHPGLYKKGLLISGGDIQWIRTDLAMSDADNREYMVRIRYRQPLQKAKLFKRGKGIYIIFNKLKRGITPCQFAVWYDGDEVIGSGVISE